MSINSLSYDEDGVYDITIVEILHYIDIWNQYFTELSTFDHKVVWLDDDTPLTIKNSVSVYEVKQAMTLVSKRFEELSEVPIDNATDQC